ncbi:MAG: HAD-IIA family hydrolase [Propioniciclava sp.]
MPVSGQNHPIRSRYRAYIFDLDGTIYLGEELLPGAAAVIADLRSQGIPVRFLSNNPTRDRQMYADKLTRLGIPTQPEEVANTVVTTTQWLRTHHPQAAVFPIAEEPLVRSLTDAGIRISEDPAEIDIVLASFDRTFDYRKLQIAFDALWFHRRAILIQTNPDRYCPMPGGHGQPDCGALTAAIEAATGVACQHNLGKPDPIMLETVLAPLGVAAADALMVGDRLETDIVMARQAGMPAAAVLTGDATRADIEALPPEVAPTFVLDSLEQLLLPAGAQG